MRFAPLALAALFIVPLVAAGDDYVWHLPKGFPEPPVPADNPMSEARVALGRLLFYEKKLSATGTHACATCHQQQHAFADTRARAVGIHGDLHPHNAMALVNVAYNPAYLWADPRVRTLEKQMLQPLYNETPVEMGLTGREAEVIRWLSASPRHREAFALAFAGEAQPIRIENVIKAIACFERTLISGRSAFDRYVFDDDRTAMSAQARRGMELFFSDRVGCGGCHSGINFSGPVAIANGPAPEALFANTALFNVDGKGRAPDEHAGIASVTKRRRDHGRFRVPTLRNIAVSAPYMHDGSLATLEDVIDHYAAGGRQAPLGPAARNRYRDARLKPFVLEVEEREALVAFLHSLTDEEFLSDRRFGPPPPAAESAP